MILATLMALAALGQSPAPIPIVPDRGAVVVSGTVRCDACGADVRALDATIRRLQASPRGDDREDAAKALRGVRWTCHPEAVHALAYALARDPDRDVRSEAAETLGRMGACLPEAHLALSNAANYDSRMGVRIEARKALRQWPRHCAGDCAICDTPPVIAPRPGISINVPIPRIARQFVPRTEVFAPGVHVSVNGRRLLPGIPVVVDPIDPLPSPEPGILPEPELTPAPRLEPILPRPGPAAPTVPDAGRLTAPSDLPPPDPTPARRPDDGASRPKPADPSKLARQKADAAVRRTVAKPVAPTTPPADLPPLEGPAGGKKP